MHMNPDIKRRWVEALRSGEYQQTEGALRHVNSDDEEVAPGQHSFCCLGVLSDLYSKDTGVPWEQASLFDTCKIHNYDAFLPQEVVDWAGFDRKVLEAKSNNGGEYDIRIDIPIKDDLDGNLHTLSEYNDEELSFAKIADLIEKYL